MTRTQSAEVKAEGNSVDAIDAGHPPPGLGQDLSRFDKVSAEVSCTNDNPIGIFFGHFADGTAAIDKGFITPGVRVEKKATAQKISWNIPWPPGFPANDVDVVSFVVGDIRTEALDTGELRIDNVVFNTVASPVSDTQHAIWNLNHFDGVDTRLTFLGGNFGEFSPVASLTGSAIQVTGDTTRSANTDGKSGASLRFKVDLNQVDFAGEFISLFGHSEFPEEYNIDLTKFSQIQFKVMSDATAEPLRLRVEVKDYRDSFEFTAYRYVTVPPSQGRWQTVV